MPSSISPSITPDELVVLYQQLEKAKNGPCAARRTLKIAFGNRFLAAIAEAHGSGQRAGEKLIALDRLTDPDTGMRICPNFYNHHLQDAIARAEAEEKKLHAQALTTATA